MLTGNPQFIHVQEQVLHGIPVPPIAICISATYSLLRLSLDLVMLCVTKIHHCLNLHRPKSLLLLETANRLNIWRKIANSTSSEYNMTVFIYFRVAESKFDDQRVRTVADPSPNLLLDYIPFCTLD